MFSNCAKRDNILTIKTDAFVNGPSNKKKTKAKSNRVILANHTERQGILQLPSEEKSRAGIMGYWVRHDFHTQNNSSSGLVEDNERKWKDGGVAKHATSWRFIAQEVLVQNHVSSNYRRMIISSCH